MESEKMSQVKAVNVLKSYFAAEMARDVEAIMEHFTPDARFTNPVEVLLGHEEIRPFYLDSCERFPVVRVNILTGLDDGTDAVAEWQAVLLSPAGEELTLKGVNVARIVEGRIHDLRAYYDAGSYGAA
jgi:ketosteroid isomerase-like protein